MYSVWGNIFEFLFEIILNLKWVLFFILCMNLFIIWIFFLLGVFDLKYIKLNVKLISCMWDNLSIFWI